MSDIPTPIIGLIIAVFVLVFLVIRTRVHALIAMLAAACIAGITGGMSIDKTLTVITQGFGSTLGSIGIVIGLGVMMGRLLEVSGAAEQIAYSFIKWLGKRREEWALAITGYIVSIPIFVDSAFVILYPVAKALAKSGKRSLLTLGVALAGGLVVTHHTAPPNRSPTASSSGSASAARSGPLPSRATSSASPSSWIPPSSSSIRWPRRWQKVASAPCSPWGWRSRVAWW